MMENKDEVVQLYLDDIIPNRFQPREVFDERALKELAVSIKEHGVIQPIIVRNVNGKYEIIAGERRYKASALAGMTKIPAIIRNLDDKESSKVALLENLQRKNLNPIEEARTYQKILEIDQMTQEELAKTMGKSQSAVANKIRLLSLSDEIQSALLKEQISERHARTLLNIPDAKKQKDMLKKIIDNKMSVRALEDEIKEMYPKEEAVNEEEAEVSIENPAVNEQVSVQTNFVNNNPLLPTSNVQPEEEINTFGKVTIAPPEEPFLGDNKKFVDVQDDDLTIPGTIVNPLIPPVPSQFVDIKANKQGEAVLDNMLNINQITGVTTKDFLTPGEQIVKQDTISVEKPKTNDYFAIPDLDSIPTLSSAPQQISLDDNIIPELPSSDIIPGINKRYSIDESKDKIRQLVNELKAGGIKISIDEMDFEKSTQMIIKIDKE